MEMPVGGVSGWWPRSGVDRNITNRAKKGWIWANTCAVIFVYSINFRQLARQEKTENEWRRRGRQVWLLADLLSAGWKLFEFQEGLKFRNKECGRFSRIIKFLPRKRLAVINSEDAVLGTWTKNSTLNLLCKNATECEAEYITELSTSSIVLFSKITEEFVVLGVGFQMFLFNFY